MRLEQGIVIRAEASWHALPVHSRVEHTAEVGRIDWSVVNREADQTAGELVHDHEHPIALEHDRLAAEEIHAPEAVGRVADKRQPRRPGSTWGGTIVLRQHATHDVLVDVDAERLRDDARHAWTPEPRIARLEFNDGLEERVARPLRSGRPGEMAGREQAAVLATDQRPMKREQC